MTMTAQGAGTLYDNEARVADLLRREPRFLVDGELVGAASGRAFPVESPFTEEVVARVPDGSAEDADRAVEAALRAHPGWADRPAPERAERVRALADAIEARAADLAVLDAVDGGAPVGIMAADVRLAVEYLRYFAGLALEVKGHSVPASTNVHFTERQPYGVVARIIRDVLPPGVVNIVTGGGPAVPEAIVRHPQVRRIGFTGSESVGRAIQRVAAAVADREFRSPLDPEAVQGTIVNRRQYDRVLSYIDGAVADGARVVTGGGAPPGIGRGLFIAPTLLDGVDPSWRIANEEVFGPVLSVLRFRDEDEAVRLANSVDYGLTGSVYTNDVRRAHRVARALEIGFVWINGAGSHFTGMPYGGWKNSGLGREESLDELLSYTQLKSVNVMLGQP